MENFQYYAPTKVVFGKGTENKAGQLVKEQNCRKVLIHYGSGRNRSCRLGNKNIYACHNTACLSVCPC